MNSDTEDDDSLSEDQKRKENLGKKMAPERIQETSTRGKGLTPNANPKTRSEQSWRLATRGRFRANGYVCA
jgi:hypothetical protein